jgi:hypothetical protein
MRIRPSALYAVTLVLACLAMSPAFGQVCTITAGGASHTTPASGHYDGDPASDLLGVGTGDYQFEDGWWFRVAGDAQEFFFPAPSTTACAAAAGTITWADVSGRGFSATLARSITSAGAGTGEVIETMTITNLSVETPLTIDLFHAVDFDVNGSFGTDVGTLVTANTEISITDTTAGNAEYQAFNPPATAYLVRAFSTTGTDVPGLLSNAAVNNFDNSGLPFASGDITSGFQWAGIVIPPGGSSSVSVAMAGNVQSTPVELLGFSID